MTPKSLMTLIVKIIGIFVLIDTLKVLPRFLKSLDSLFVNQWNGEYFIFNLSIAVAIIFIYFILIRYLLLKADLVVDKLGLAKNFQEEEISINIHRSTLIQVAVVIAGCLIFITNIASLAVNLYLFIQDQEHEQGVAKDLSGFAFEYHPFNRFKMYESIILVLLGYALATNSGPVTNWIENKRRKMPAIDEQKEDENA